MGSFFVRPWCNFEVMHLGPSGMWRRDLAGFIWSNLETGRLTVSRCLYVQWCSIWDVWLIAARCGAFEYCILCVMQMQGFLEVGCSKHHRDSPISEIGWVLWIDPAYLQRSHAQVGQIDDALIMSSVLSKPLIIGKVCTLGPLPCFTDGAVCSAPLEPRSAA